MAIAFDAASNGAYGASVGSITWNHTCSGSNRVLIVAVGEDRAVNAGTVTGVTYNGVAMTMVARRQGLDANNLASLWILIAPATGTNAVVVTASVVNFWEISGCSASYTGCSQTGQPNASNTATVTSSTTAALAVTPVADSCWAVLACGNRGGTRSAGTATTKRAEEAANFESSLFDSNAAISPAASTTLTTTTVAATDSEALVIVALAPFGSATAQVIAGLPYITQQVKVSSY